EDLPAENWTAPITPRLYRRAARAMDFAAFCADPDVDITCKGTYVLWLRSRRLFPDLRFLKRLYGWPGPKGVYFVTPELKRLKHEQGRKGILVAVREKEKEKGNDTLDDAIIWRWQRDERTARPINSILARGKGKDGKGWQQLDAETRRLMSVV